MAIQTLITFGAMIILTLGMLGFNNRLADSDQALAKNRFRFEALAIANSYAEDARQYYFDEAVADTFAVKNVSQFTDLLNLGQEGDDNGVNDDFDDFHNRSIQEFGQTGVPYSIRFKVDYVKNDLGNLVTSTDKTYHKRMRISICDTLSPPLIFRFENGIKMRDTLHIEIMQSYWFYN